VVNSALRPTDVRNPRPFPSTTENGNRQSTAHRHERRPAAEPDGRRFDRVTIGLFFGGVALGTAGCILGASMPYRHPVGVTISVLWWGTYLGCLGASIGAGIGGLLGCWWDQRERK